MSIITMKNVQNKLIKSITSDIESIGLKWNRLVELNNILKGFRPGELSVFSGKTGTGKTTLLSEYSLDLAETGVRTLWGTFEISVVKLSKILLTQYKRKDLHDIDSKVLCLMVNEFLNEVPMYFIDDQGEQDDKSLMETLMIAHKEYNIEHIVLDNLQFMVGVKGTSMTDKMHSQDKFVGNLRRFVNQTKIHVTLIAHPRKENNTELLSINSLYGGCKLSQEADNILLLQSVESQNKKYLQVMKNRHSGTLGSMSLRFNPETLTFSVPQYQRKSLLQL